MIFNSFPTYLKKGPLLVEFALQSQSRSKKKIIPAEDNRIPT